MRSKGELLNFTCKITIQKDVRLGGNFSGVKWYKIRQVIASKDGISEIYPQN